MGIFRLEGHAVPVPADDDAAVRQNMQQRVYIRQVRHMLNGQRLAGEQARTHQRQYGVLG